MSSNLMDLVREAYGNAIENGMDFDDWEAFEIAADMQYMDSDLENYSISEIVKCLNEIHKKKGTL